MKAIKIVIIAVVIISNSCHSKGNQNNITDKENVFIQSDKKDSIPIISESIGVITTNEQYEFGDTIKVYNADRRYKTFIIITDEYQKLKLLCRAKERGFYKVLLEDNSIGYLDQTNPHLKFQTWPEHILDVFSVEFNPRTNPILEKPDTNSHQLRYDENEFYHPHQIQEDWLQIKWGTEGDWKYGWIRWREDGKLLIELFYFA